MFMLMNLRSAFKRLNGIQPTEGLECRIMEAILVERRRLIRYHQDLGYVGLSVSLLMLWAVSMNSADTFFRSEFWSVGSLLFSDVAIVSEHWQNYGYSLLETFPALPVAALLFPIFLFFLSMGWYASATRPRLFLKTSVFSH